MSEPAQPEPAAGAPAQPAAANTSPVRDGEALVNDIVREIRKDSVREAALAKLKKPSARERFSKLFQHPAMLLVMGFALTSIVGLLLTHEIQKQEWERQQRRLVEIRDADLKYAIMDELIKAVGVRNAAATAVVEPLLGPVRESQLRLLKVDPAERFKGWLTAVYDWRYSTQVLRLKLKAHIREPQAQWYFDEIIERGKEINANVIELQTHANANNWALDAKAGDLLDNIDTAKEQTDKYLVALTKTIVAEAQEGIKKEKP